MQTSLKGLIDIVSHEGVCLEWYYDSVGVPTIGVGQTKYDGFDPRATGSLSIKRAFDLFKDRLRTYEKAVDQLGRDLSQTQYDALVSFCYNCGPGNLRKLCRADRDLQEIGQALMLYVNPPEVTGRRRKEQVLFQNGLYSNTDGRVTVFPVNAMTRKPMYMKGYKIDVRPYLETAEPIEPAPVPVHVSTPTTPAPEPVKSEPWSLKTLFERFF